MGRESRLVNVDSDASEAPLITARFDITRPKVKSIPPRRGNSPPIAIRVEREREREVFHGYVRWARDHLACDIFP